MIEIDYRGFLLSAVVGLPICCAFWFFARSWAARNWLVRAILSLAFATALSPSLPFSPHGPHSMVMPAVYFLQFVTDGVDGLVFAMLFGLLPIIVTGSIFFTLSWLLSRRHNANRVT
jgi:hypothetical protein